MRFRIARVVLVIRHTSPFGSIWKMREHVAISCWFGLVGSHFTSYAFLLGFSARISSRIGDNRGRCFRKRFLPASFSSEGDFLTSAASSSTTSSENGSSNLNTVSSTSFSGTRLPLAGSCSHAPVSNDGVADCFCDRDEQYQDVRCRLQWSFFPLVHLEVFSWLPREGASQLIVRVVQRTALKDHLPPTPGYKPSLFGGTDDAERGLNFHVAFRGEVKGSTSITCTEAPPVDNVH